MPSNFLVRAASRVILTVSLLLLAASSQSVFGQG